MTGDGYNLLIKIHNNILTATEVFKFQLYQIY